MLNVVKPWDIYSTVIYSTVIYPPVIYSIVMLNVVKHLNTSTCANRFLTPFEMTGEKESGRQLSGSLAGWTLLIQSPT